MAKASPTTVIMPVPNQKPVLNIRKRRIWKKENVPERMRATETRYEIVSSPMLAPEAPARSSGGDTTGHVSQGPGRNTRYGWELTATYHG